MEEIVNHLKKLEEKKEYHYLEYINKLLLIKLNEGYINQIPDEILLRIFEYIHINDTYNIDLVCMRWNNLFKNVNLIDKIVKNNIYQYIRIDINELYIQKYVAIQDYEITPIYYERNNKMLYEIEKIKRYECHMDNINHIKFLELIMNTHYNKDGLILLKNTINNLYKKYIYNAFILNEEYDNEDGNEVFSYIYEKILNLTKNNLYILNVMNNLNKFKINVKNNSLENLFIDGSFLKNIETIEFKKTINIYVECNEKLDIKNAIELFSIQNVKLIIKQYDYIEYAISLNPNIYIIANPAVDHIYMSRHKVEKIRIFLRKLDIINNVKKVIFTSYTSYIHCNISSKCIYINKYNIFDYFNDIKKAGSYDI